MYAYEGQTKIQANQQAAAAVSAATPAPAASDVLTQILNLLAPEFTYIGGYRNTTLTIPAGQTNYEVDLGFPGRVFRLDTEFPITIRIANAQADQIYLDYQTAPFDLPNIPAGLSFSSFFVTNQSTTPITLNLFAMG